jgi:lipopolysaccharide transport system ATP-binding protein
VIGRNGAGKSTLLKILSRITEPTSGYADVYGRIGSLLEVGMGFHRELTGRENILLNGAILGMTKREILRKFDEIVAFAEVDKFIDTPVKQYSTGMYLRLAFAVAAHLEPDILLVDEILAVGDVAFQTKCLGKMEDVAKTGRTVLFVSHNMAAVRSLCTAGIVLDGGSVAYAGEVGRSIEAYYRLIGAIPGENGDRAGDTGNGRSVFGRVALHDVKGNTIANSQGFAIATTLNVRDSIAGFTIVCEIQDMHRRSVCKIQRESTGLGLTDIRPGEYGVCVELPALWLNPGLYSAGFEVEFWSDFATGRKAVSDTFPLDVAGPTSSREAVLSPPADWSVEPRGQL